MQNNVKPAEPISRTRCPNGQTTQGLASKTQIIMLRFDIVSSAITLQTHSTRRSLPWQHL